MAPKTSKPSALEWATAASDGGRVNPVVARREARRRIPDVQDAVVGRLGMLKGDVAGEGGEDRPELGGDVHR